MEETRAMSSGLGVTDGGGFEQTSPDMLRNTPSNIRRLADEIQQFEGRKKYLAQTRSASDGGDVRWYFCKVPLAENELAASVPHTEIVGKGEYFRFGMRDSLAIEASFLQREEDLLSSWWKEYAECSIGPSGRLRNLNKQSQECHLESPQPAPEDASEDERVGVPVKGGLYEVDLVQRHCFPVYWNGENRRVLRGHWFALKGGLDWLPLREDIAEQLEFAYRGKVWRRRTFQPSGLFAARVDLQGSTLGLHALFTGEDETWEAWLNCSVSGFSHVINFGGNAIKLRRGYAPSQSPKPTQDELRQQREEEMDDYCSQVPVGHLVFMVHGIGQRLEKSNLVDDVGNFRHITASLAEKHLTSYQRGTQRVLYIPCQWRKGLKLSGESAVEKITLDGVRGLRTMLSATVHDVLYYMSPIYCQAIIDSVSGQLNKLYLKFLKRNPGYDGKVSLYGHSLGSVLSYDILCHQEILSSPFPMEWMYKVQKGNEASQTTANNSSSCCNFPSNSAEQKVINSETKIVDTVDRQRDNPEKCSNVEECSKDFCNPSCPPLPSSLDEPAARKIGGEQTGGASLSDEKINERPLNGLISHQGNGEIGTTCLNSVVECNQNKFDEAAPEDEKDKTIKSLMEELNLLNARIRELESISVGKESGEKTSKMKSQPISTGTPLEESDLPKSYTPHIKYTKLEFKVDTFFAVGSPLGVFLSLRNVRIGIGKGQEYWEEENINEEMPACRQMFNIFHPFDPVAYRIEPLVCKEYINRRPVIIPYHRGGKRLHVGFQEFKEDLTLRTQALKENISYVKVKVLTICESRDQHSINEASESSQEQEQRSYGSIMMERLTGSEDGRIDHVLQDKTFRHPYISAIGSHTNYWRDKDTALFMLKYLYRDVPEEPQLNEPAAGSSEGETGSEGWFDHREATDEEELPLTFANKTMVNRFSRRAKKTLKN